METGHGLRFYGTDKRKGRKRKVLGLHYRAMALLDRAWVTMAVKRRQ